MPPPPRSSLSAAGRCEGVLAPAHEAAHNGNPRPVRSGSRKRFDHRTVHIRASRAIRAGEVARVRPVVVARKRPSGGRRELGDDVRRMPADVPGSDRSQHRSGAEGASGAIGEDRLVHPGVP